MADRIVDARGRSCPEPVVMTKKALETIQGEFQVLVDSEVARKMCKDLPKTKVVKSGWKREATNGRSLFHPEKRGKN